MSARMNGTEMRPAAERLAKALRSGLELRWSIPTSRPNSPNPFPPRGSVRPFLEPYADSLRFRLPRRRPLLHRLVWAARCLVRKLIAPWLHIQSHFNLSLVSVVEQVEQRVRTLEDAELVLRQAIEMLEKTLLSRADNELGRQIDTLEDGFLLRINQELGRQGKIGQAGLWFDPPVQVQLDRNGPRVAGVSARILEQIYVHTHLPRPPARLLVLGCCDSTSAIEMASLGFQVVGIDSRPMPLRHPNLTMIQGHLHELPCEDESFDGAVILSTLGSRDRAGLSLEERDAADEQIISEVFRTLKRGARLILTVPFGQSEGTLAQPLYDRAQLDRLLRAFRIVERGYGIRDADTWSFTLDEQRAEQTESSDCVSAVCLLVLEKP
jgi:SAM-dependent methyltransferase